MKERIWRDRQGIEMLNTQINTLQGKNQAHRELINYLKKEIKGNDSQIVSFLERIEEKMKGEVRHEVRKR